jgi:3-oxo-5-alpha-steroid 4-dehydrogenase 3
MHFCTLLSLVLLTVHVSIRLYECYFVHRTSKSARQHIGVTLFGVAHYAFVVLSLLSSTSSVITLERSMLKLLHFDTFVSDSMLVAPKWDVHVDVFLSIISVLLFAVGRFHQSVCHNILASLRSLSGSDAYFIPFGDWFSVSASPHYTAELLIYLALCILQPTNVCCWYASRLFEMFPDSQSLILVFHRSGYCLVGLCAI